MAKDSGSSNNNKVDKDEIVEKSSRIEDINKIAGKKDEQSQLKEESIQEHPEH